MVPKQVVPDRRGLVEIGKIKENLVTEVAFDCADLGDGSGAYAVVFQRPKGSATYPVAFRAEWPTIVWIVHDADTAKPGTGKLEIRWFGNRKEVGKSKTYMVRINDGLPDPTEAPQEWEGYIGQVAKNAQRAETAASKAETAAKTTADDADAAKTARAGAEQAASIAVDAVGAAAASAGAAQAAQTAAAQSQTAAGSSAAAAASSAQAAADTLAQVKDDLAAGKLKGEKGDPGKDAPQIDDNTVTDSNPWSSKKIIETLCPPIAESGNPVTCYPVAGYPLGVKVSWEPTQAGSGEPSPDNIRPISGRQTVKVERCGENVIEFLSTEDFNSGIKIAVDAEKNITLNGTVVVKSNIVIGMCRLHWVAGKTYTMYIKKVGGSASLGSDDGITFAYSLFTMDYNHFFRGDTNSKNLDAYIASKAALAETELIFMLQCWRVNTVFNNFKFQIEVVEGTTAPTAYTPYQGDTLDLQLPETIYGGSVDAVMGDGTSKWGFVTLDGTEAWTVQGKFLDDKSDWYYVSPKIPGAVNESPRKGNDICSHYPHADVANNNAVKGCAIVWGAIRVRWGDTIPDNADGWKAYLAAQYAAGTPVQIAYKLAQHVPIQATGAQPIPALAGCNTVLTDADTVTVTGRADPAHAIAALQAQLAVATQQLVETQEAVVDTTGMAVDYIYEQDSQIIGGDDDDDQTNAMPT